MKEWSLGQIWIATKEKERDPLSQDGLERERER
jgi:hypothetical protein